MYIIFIFIRYVLNTIKILKMWRETRLKLSFYCYAFWPVGITFIFKYEINKNSNYIQKRFCVKLGKKKILIEPQPFCR